MRLNTLDTKEKSYILMGTPISLLVELPINLTMQAGNTIAFESKIIPFVPEERTGFTRYTWLHGLVGRVKPWSFNTLSWSQKSWADTVGEKIHDIFFQGFPHDIAGLLLGVTIGNTELFTADMEDNFKNAGLTHILVVSGSNITFLIVFLSFFLQYLP